MRRDGKKIFWTASELSGMQQRSKKRRASGIGRFVDEFSRRIKSMVGAYAQMQGDLYAMHFVHRAPDGAGG